MRGRNRREPKGIAIQTGVQKLQLMAVPESNAGARLSPQPVGEVGSRGRVMRRDRLADERAGSPDEHADGQNEASSGAAHHGTRSRPTARSTA